MPHHAIPNLITRHRLNRRPRRRPSAREEITRHHRRRARLARPTIHDGRRDDARAIIQNALSVRVRDEERIQTPGRAPPEIQRGLP